MSAQVRAAQAVSTLDVIKEISELVKNPSEIIKAHDLIREQIRLTEIEDKKFKEAKIFIEKYDTLKAELDSKEAKLNKKALDNENIFKEFEKYSKEITITVDKKLADISEKEKELETLKNQYLVGIDDLRTLENQFSATKKVIEDKLEDREIEVSNLEISLNKRQEEIEVQEKILKEKAVKLQSIMA